MSESFLTDLGKLYAEVTKNIHDASFNVSELKDHIEEMKSNNGYDTHGLPQEKENIELYYRKLSAFINQE